MGLNGPIDFYPGLPLQLISHNRFFQNDRPELDKPITIFKNYGFDYSLIYDKNGTFLDK